MKNTRNISAIAGIVGGFIILAGASSADTPAPPGSNPAPPKPLPELTAEWWQWAYSIPQPFDASGNPVAPYNPIQDPSGAYCAVGQRGSVWFLAGDALTQPPQRPVQRSCFIPEGASILFPVINFVNFNTPGCPTGTPPMNVQALLGPVQQSIEAVNSTNSISATVDGMNVTKTLVKFVQSEPFGLAFPAQNIYGSSPCASGVPLAPKTYSPSVAAGYYVWLPPLTVGPHRISFYAYEATAPLGPNYQDVIYNITVCSAAQEFSGSCSARSGS